MQLYNLYWNASTTVEKMGRRKIKLGQQFFKHPDTNGYIKNWGSRFVADELWEGNWQAMGRERLGCGGGGVWGERKPKEKDKMNHLKQSWKTLHFWGVTSGRVTNRWGSDRKGWGERGRGGGFSHYFTHDNTFKMATLCPHLKVPPEQKREKREQGG